MLPLNDLVLTKIQQKWFDAILIILILSTDEVNVSLEKAFMVKSEYLSSRSHERLSFSREVQHKILEKQINLET